MVLILRVSVALSCGGIVFSMFACLLDLCGTMNRCLKVIKDYSIGNVISGTSVPPVFLSGDNNCSMTQKKA